MAKVTEQDLLDRGFKNLGSNFYSQYFKTKFTESEIEIFIDINNEIIKLYHYGLPMQEMSLTHANLDLFIRFAEGKEL